MKRFLLFSVAVFFVASTVSLHNNRLSLNQAHAEVSSQAKKKKKQKKVKRKCQNKAEKRCTNKRCRQRVVKRCKRNENTCRTSSCFNNLVSLDLSNAKTLLIQQRSSNTRAKKKTPKLVANSLYKIIDGGKLLKVPSFSPDGEQFYTLLHPVQIYPINDDYMAISYDHIQITTPDDPEVIVLLRKSDGATFILEGFSRNIVRERNFYHNSMGFINDKVFRSDDQGNIYYPTRVCETTNDSSGIPYLTNCLRRIVRVDVSDSENLVAQEIMPPGEDAEAVFVNPQGYVWYAGRANEMSVARIITPSGTVLNALQYTSLTPGPDGEFFYTEHYDRDEEELGGATRVNRLEFNEEDEAVVTEYAPELNDLIVYGVSMIDYRFVFPSRVIVVRSKFTIDELMNPEKTPRNLKNTVEGLSELKSVSFAAQNATHYFISGLTNDADSIFLKVSADSSTVQELLPRNTYDVTKFTVDDEGNITFAGLRYEDGVTLTAEIVDGEITIIDESSNAPPESLEQF